MKVNLIEKLFVTSPIREWFQKNVEAKALYNMGGAVSGNALEIGCGGGYGIEIIQKVFHANNILAIDIDQDMVDKATKRCQHLSNVTIQQQGIQDLLKQNQTFSAAFDFSVLHHIPNWQEAVAAMYQVIEPEGQFYIEEFYKRLICNPVINKIVDHPQENRFNHSELLSELKRVGFSIVADKHWFDCVGLIVAKK